MGACFKSAILETTDIDKTLRDMIEDARERYGSDYYSGEINNSHWNGRFHRVLKGTTKAQINKNIKSLGDISDLDIEKNWWIVSEVGQKGCFLYNNTVKMYEKTTQVLEFNGRKFKNQTEIKKYVENNDVIGYIRLNDFTMVGKVERIGRTVKTKPVQLPKKYKRMKTIKVFFCGIWCPE